MTKPRFKSKKIKKETNIFDSAIIIDDEVTDLSLYEKPLSTDEESSVVQKPLSETNPHLIDPVKRKALIKRSVETSSAVEGIKVK